MHSRCARTKTSRSSIWACPRRAAGASATRSSTSVASVGWPDFADGDCRPHEGEPMATKKAAKKKSRRTVLYSSGGKKLYAVRDASGKFKDIQQYSRAHAADIKRGSSAEQKAAAKKAARKSTLKRAAKGVAKRATAARKAAGKLVGRLRSAVKRARRKA